MFNTQAFHAIAMSFTWIATPGLWHGRTVQSWLKAWSGAREKDGGELLWSLPLGCTSVVLVVSILLNEGANTEKAEVCTVLYYLEVHLVGCMCWKCKTYLEGSHSEGPQRLSWGLPKRCLPTCWFTEPPLIKLASELNESCLEWTEYFCG